MIKSYKGRKIKWQYFVQIKKYKSTEGKIVKINKSMDFEVSN